MVSAAVPKVHVHPGSHRRWHPALETLHDDLPLLLAMSVVYRVSLGRLVKAAAGEEKP